MTSQPQIVPVVIILVNYRGTDDTLACLASLKDSLHYPQYQIIVVDNASPDDSVKRLQAAQASFNFELIASDINGGFSAGNNLAIRSVLNQIDHGALPEKTHVWLLNNDTTVDPEALTSLVTLSEKTKGISGSLLLYPDGRYQQVGTRMNWWTGSTRGYSKNRLREGLPVMSLSGASMLIPAAVFRQIGLLEESYFLYFEDAEFCLRAARAGISSNISLNSKVYHIEGSSTGRSSLATQYYFHRNRLRVLAHYAPSPLQKACIEAYQRFRLWRNGLKTAINPTTDRRRSMTVQQWAYHDYITGVSGPCPHDLKQLETT